MPRKFGRSLSLRSGVGTPFTSGVRSYMNRRDALLAERFKKKELDLREKEDIRQERQQLAVEMEEFGAPVEEIEAGRRMKPGVGRGGIPLSERGKQIVGSYESYADKFKKKGAPKPSSKAPPAEIPQIRLRIKDLEDKKLMGEIDEEESSELLNLTARLRELQKTDKPFEPKRKNPKDPMGLGLFD